MTPSILREQVRGMSTGPDLALAIAAAFGLSGPVGFEVVQVGSYETWRLDAATDAYLVKRLWRRPDPERRSELERAMAFEERVVAAGISTPARVQPVVPEVGCAGRVDGHGTFRVYEWIEHREPEPTDDFAAWVGATLATLHGIEPLDAGFEPEWRWLGVRRAEDWKRWIAADRQWGPLARERLPLLTRLTQRLESHHRTGDHVISHRDFGPWNVLNATTGPVLVDWESAGPIKASAEVGRVLSAFGNGNSNTMRRILAAYEEAGGRLRCEPTDLFAWELAHHLSNITERIAIALGEEPRKNGGAWMSYDTVDQDVEERLQDLPKVVERFDDLGTEVLTRRRST